MVDVFYNLTPSDIGRGGRGIGGHCRKEPAREHLLGVVRRYHVKQIIGTAFYNVGEP